MVSPMDHLMAALRVLIAALVVRIFGAWVLGEGAPFGPDGTGAEASFILGGHPYPLHMGLLHLTGGSARSLSMASGALSAALLWSWGKREGLGGGGGWLAVVVPLCVLPSVLAAGDAPALTVVLCGVWITTLGGPWVYLGGALAAASVGVKPIALGALVLLLARPRSLFAAAPVLLLLHGFTRPLWGPVPGTGLLGTWWAASEGVQPGSWLSWLSWLMDGLRHVARAPLWAGVALLPLTLLSAWRLPGRRWLWLSLGLLAGTLGTAALFGDRLEARYLAAPVCAALPLIAHGIGRRGTAVLACLLVWPTLGVLTQLGEYRQTEDPLALVPDMAVVPFPVDPRPLFDACSTSDATRMRQLAFQIAEVAPQGATITTQARPDGREGELFWPLQVLRPDLKVQPSN
jgi:hypothetical protein